MSNFQPSASTPSSGSTPNAVPVSAGPSFFELPLELRLMVYNYIPVETSRHTIGSASRDKWPCGQPVRGAPLYHVIHKSISTSILRTCREVYKEAKPVLHKKYNYIMIPKMVVDFSEHQKHMHSCDYCTGVYNFLQLHRSLNPYYEAFQIIRTTHKYNSAAALSERESVWSMTKSVIHGNMEKEKFQMCVNAFINRLLYQTQIGRDYTPPEWGWTNEKIETAHPFPVMELQLTGISFEAQSPSQLQDCIKDYLYSLIIATLPSLRGVHSPDVMKWSCTVDTSPLFFILQHTLLVSRCVPHLSENASPESNLIAFADAVNRIFFRLKEGPLEDISGDMCIPETVIPANNVTEEEWESEWTEDTPPKNKHRPRDFYEPRPENRSQSS